MEPGVAIVADQSHFWLESKPRCSFASGTFQNESRILPTEAFNSETSRVPCNQLLLSPTSEQSAKTGTGIL